MAEIINLTNLVDLQNESTAVTAINNNNAAITSVFTDVLSRSGIQPNKMASNLDMNSNRILNLPSAVSTSEPVPLSQLTSILSGGTINLGVTTVPVSGVMQPVVNASTIAIAQSLLGFPYINVKTLGATGNGVTDDTAAIQNAITAASTNSAGGTSPVTVFFPNGNYLISSTLVIPATCGVITILGENSQETTITTSTSGIDILHYTLTNFATLRLKGLGFSCPNASAVIFGSSSVIVTQSIIEDCRFLSSNYGIQVINGSAINIYNCFFEQFAVAAIQISSPSNTDGGDCWIHHNFFIQTGGLTGAGICVSHISGGGWKITNNKMLNATYGIFSNLALPNTTCSDLHIEDNSIEGMAQNCIAITNQSSTQGGLENVIIVGNEGGSTGVCVLLLAPGNRPWIINCLIATNVWRTVNGIGVIGVNGIINNINITANAIDDAGTGSAFAINVGTQCTNGLITSNSITNYVNKVVSTGTNITAANNGP